MDIHRTMKGVKHGIPNQNSINFPEERKSVVCKFSKRSSQGNEFSKRRNNRMGDRINRNVANGTSKCSQKKSLKVISKKELTMKTKKK